ncbi:hypothetical protein [Ornithinimicrobium kibberense]|uniref:hypothetical protein n=1 Tax=Ornithinimicrobium kibberense TaxID=282060 RepID=UPI00360CCE47
MDSPSRTAGSSACRSRVEAEAGASSRARMASSRSMAVRGLTVSGFATSCSSPVPTTSRYTWLASRPRVIIVYSCWRDSCPVARPWVTSTDTPWAVCTVEAYPSSTLAAT